ncbi:glycoside hydrolase family 3 protein [Polymorphobacter fuscus]|nr:glycoside hydrolase family 3 protein [Polymorphobacter fuscus]NJC07306.1 beta-glucosidase [Polymorphobacter fuscus]
MGAPAVAAGVADPSVWPVVADPVPADPALEARLAAILGRMSVEQKVGQVIQADVASVTPDDVARYHLGSILNGGNSAPGGKRYATGPEWLAGADAFYEASVRPQGKLPVIPIIWGSDAVHGHSKAIGATLFPHNIGLGAMRDPELMRKIGTVTATEMRVTGLDWTFAPTLAVVRDDRWGRSYEGFSEDPAVVASYAGPFVEGLQGKVGAADWLKGPHIVATAKHFVGDGGTTNGKDQGDNDAPEAELRDVQAAGYPPALKAGVQSVMASYSSWQGAKMHGNASLLTGVLKGRMGFGGFVVGDWNGHGQLPGCSPTDCPGALVAGMDMFMAPDSWKALHASTLKAVQAGTLPMARLDDAVARILRVKLRAGVFDDGKPSARPFGGKFELLGGPAHRAIARQAVRQSLVLLKNDGGALPLKPGQKLLVAGDGADSFMKQSGGWTLTWQGTGLKREDFPGATTIGAALVAAAGGAAELRPDGNYTAKPDVAVVVFGEDPYAEFQGDLPDLAFRDRADSLALLKRYRAAGVRTVAVFLSGRPLWVNPWINAADAFVAAWLPGSEGGGVADVLFGKADFTGKLPFSWPRTATQTRLNVGDPGYDPLFAFGYGLSYARPGRVASLSEDSGIVGGAGQPAGTWFQRGKIGTGLAMELAAAGASVPVAAGPAATANGWLRTAPVDRNAQEDSVRLTWSGGGPAQVVLRSAPPIDIARESNGELSIEIDVSADTLGTAPLLLGMGDARGIDLAPALRRGTGWQTVSVRLSCFAARGVDMTKVAVPLRLSTSAATDLRVSRIALGSTAAGAVSCD